MNKIKFSFIFTIFSLFSLSGVCKLSAQQNYNIDYYGVVSTVLDANMAKMTSDLYYTQLSEISNFNVSDLRTDSFSETEPDPEVFNQNNISFYSEIKKNEDSSVWTCTFDVYDSSSNQNYSETKQYDSFYKILMEPKSSLQATIKSLIEGNTSVSQNQGAAKNSQNTNISTEFLSGTWDGEDFIDKIVIMRGGRGFVIFNNGASMNITVALKKSSAGGTEVSVKQNGRSNASFYPEIPRNVALKAAVDAPPIEWTFTLIDDNTLTGKKSTLIASSGDAVPATLDVTWNRKN